jgi:hypothetical protein
VFLSSTDYPTLFLHFLLSVDRASIDRWDSSPQRYHGLLYTRVYTNLSILSRNVVVARPSNNMS